MCGGGGGGTTTTIQDIPPEFKPAFTSLFNSAFGASRTAAGQPPPFGFGQPFQGGASEASNFITGTTPLGLSPQQNTGAFQNPFFNQSIAQTPFAPGGQGLQGGGGGGGFGDLDFSGFFQPGLDLNRLADLFRPNQNVVDGIDTDVINQAFDRGGFAGVGALQQSPDFSDFTFQAGQQQAQQGRQQGQPSFGGFLNSIFGGGGQQQVQAPTPQDNLLLNGQPFDPIQLRGPQPQNTLGGQAPGSPILQSILDRNAQFTNSAQQNQFGPNRGINRAFDRGVNQVFDQGGFLGVGEFQQNLLDRNTNASNLFQTSGQDQGFANQSPQRNPNQNQSRLLEGGTFDPSGFTGGSSFGGFRQQGGPVNPAQSFAVGENGPELFVPNAPGTIVPLQQPAVRSSAQLSSDTGGIIAPGFNPDGTLIGGPIGGFSGDPGTGGLLPLARFQPTRSDTIRDIDPAVRFGALPRVFGIPGEDVRTGLPDPGEFRIDQNFIDLFEQEGPRFLQGEGINNASNLQRLQNTPAGDATRAQFTANLNTLRSNLQFQELNDLLGLNPAGGSGGFNQQGIPVGGNQVPFDPAPITGQGTLPQPPQGAPPNFIPPTGTGTGTVPPPPDFSQFLPPQFQPQNQPQAQAAPVQPAQLADGFPPPALNEAQQASSDLNAVPTTTDVPQLNPNIQIGLPAQTGENIPLAPGPAIIGPRFPENFTPGTSPLEFESLAQRELAARQFEGLGSSLLNLGQFTAGGGFLGPESNPFLEQNINAALRPVAEQFTRSVVPQFNSQAIQSGAFKGSSARDLAFNQLASGFGQQLSDTAAQIQFDNFNRERVLQTQAGQLLGEGSQLQQLSPELLAQVGLGQRTLAQRPLDEALLQFQESINAPFRPLFPLASIIQGGDIGSIFSTQVPRPSGISQGITGALGGAAAGLSLVSALSDSTVVDDIQNIFR